MPALLWALLLAACSDGTDTADTGVSPGRVLVQAAPFRLSLAMGESVRVRQSGPLRLTLDSGGEATLTALLAERTQGDERVLTVRTDAGSEATVTVPRGSCGSCRVQIGHPRLASVGLAWALEPGEAIYGLTERLRDSAVLVPALNGPLAEDFDPDPDSSLDRRGDIVEMFVRPTIALYAPLYHSSRGFGLWIEGSMPGVFDVGASARDALRIDMEVVPGGVLAFHFLPGPDHATILRRYYELTGFPVRVPDWAFSHWRWRDELTPAVAAELDGTLVNAEIAEDVLMYERFGIPPGVYLFDRPYLAGGEDPDSEGFHRFEWDALRLPAIDATLNALRERGYRLAVWSAPWARNNGPGSHGAEAAELGYLAPGSDRVIDFTNPAAAAWWRDKLASFLAEYGIEGIKLDRGEEYVPSDTADFYSDGRRGREVHNDFPRLQARVHHDALEAAGLEEGVVMARAGYSGSQRWAIAWGGDDVGTESGLRSAIVKLQRAGFLGFPVWGSDTGGYYPFSDREVFARWLQFSALTPIMEIGGIGSRSPWNMPTEPRFDAGMIDIYARYVRLHHDLIPYTSELAAAASAGGAPIARAMVFDYPDDARFLDAWDQYMYGPDLLVAPLWQSGARQREVLLPAGEWEFFWDRARRWTGPARITVDAPLDTLPLFVRAGADRF